MAVNGTLKDIAREHDTVVLSAVDGVGAEPDGCFADPDPLCGSTSTTCDPLDHHDHNDVDGDGLGHEEDDPCPCDPANVCTGTVLGCFEADINGDHVVGIPDWLNGDHVVGIPDWLVFAQHFGCEW